MLRSTRLPVICRRRTQLWGSRSLATEAVLAVDQVPAVSRTYVKPHMKAAVVLNRSPILTATPTPFERAYFTYQARLTRIMSNPFPQDFYFTPGSLTRTRFNIEERLREKNAFGTRLRRLTPADRKRILEDNIKDAQLREQEDVVTLMPRVHPADAARDLQNLNRKGRRNLYLLVGEGDKTDELQWRFPQGGLLKGELLHQAAQRDMYDECGEHMDTWLVAKTPIGHYRPPPSPSNSDLVTFFFKAHILAGQVQLAPGLRDFAWLTKQEIEQKVDDHYWHGVKNMLSDY